MLEIEEFVAKFQQVLFLFFLWTPEFTDVEESRGETTTLKRTFAVRFCSVGAFDDVLENSQPQPHYYLSFSVPYFTSCCLVNISFFS